MRGLPATFFCTAKKARRLSVAEASPGLKKNLFASAADAHETKWQASTHCTKETQSLSYQLLMTPKIRSLTYWASRQKNTISVFEEVGNVRYKQ